MKNFCFGSGGDYVKITVPNSGMDPLGIEFQGVTDDFGLVAVVLHDFNTIIRSTFSNKRSSNNSNKKDTVQISSNVLKYMNVENVDMEERKIKKRQQMRNQIIEEKNKNSEYNQWMDRIQSEMKN